MGVSARREDRAVHVSISKLGAGQSGAGGAARAVVEYLTGQQDRKAGIRGEAPELAHEASPGGYYADSAQQPGHWHGGGVEHMIPTEDRGFVQPQHLERLLLGQHAVTGEQLVAASGSAGRADQSNRPEIEVHPTGPASELLTADQAAQLIGIAEKRYLNALARKTMRIRSEITASTPAGTTAPALPKTYLDGVRVPGETQNRPEWRFARGEIERFISQRKQPKVVMGFDLTYSAPKETSLAWAVADPEGESTHRVTSA